MTALTTAERAELAALNSKALHVYIGFNLNRKSFAEKADAERCLELTTKEWPDTAYHHSYGALCQSRVERGQLGGKEVWEMVYG